MIPVSTVIPDEIRSLPTVRYDNVEVAVIIEITNCRASPNVFDLESRSALCRDIAEGPVLIVIEQVSLLISQAWIVKLDIVDDVSVGDIDIGVPIVVVVEELCPKAQCQESRAQPGLLRDLFKSSYPGDSGRAHSILLRSS